MSWGYVAVGAATLITGVMQRNNARKTAEEASGAQIGYAQSAIDEQRRQFEIVQKLMAPYIEAGGKSLGAQQDLLGLNGSDAQQKAIDAIQSSPQFTALAQQGENAMMQSAAATGGLRGGNFQAAMSQFRPRMLSGLIEQQYNRLGGMTAMGQATVAQQAQQVQRLGESISDQYSQMGAAKAGAAQAAGQAQGGLLGTVGNVAGSMIGGFMGGKF